jgi:hypothetical protein
VPQEWLVWLVWQIGHVSRARAASMGAGMASVMNRAHVPFLLPLSRVRRCSVPQPTQAATTSRDQPLEMIETKVQPLSQDMATELEESQSQAVALKEANTKLEAHAKRLDEEADLAKVSACPLVSDPRFSPTLIRKLIRKACIRSTLLTDPNKEGNQESVYQIHASHRP